MLEDTGHPLAQPASCNGHMVFSDDRRQQLTLTPAGHKNKETKQQSNQDVFVKYPSREEHISHQRRKYFNKVAKISALKAEVKRRGYTEITLHRNN